MSAAVLLAAETEHHGRELPMDPLAYGLIAFSILVALLLLTMAFGKDR